MNRAGNAPPPPRRERAQTPCATLVGAALLLAAGVARGAGAPGPDTIGVRIETGAGTDITNEQYYEDAFIDTTFLGRHRVNTPETRYAGVLYAVVQGTRGERRAAYQFQNELSIGDKVQRDALSMSWRDDLAPGWRTVLNPSIEWRHDRTFDRDQEEWRGSVRGRLRRSFAEDATTAELGVVGDFVRTSGEGSEFLLDRNAGRASIALDHLGLPGDEWRLGYGLATRVFPDSSVRDHLEHGWQGRWRHAFVAGHALTLETSGLRRQTRRIANNSRDNFWDEFATLEADWRAAARWALRLRLEGEALQYDLQDSTIFFDYQIARARLGLRYESQGHWSLSAGPRGEILASRLNPGEGYREIGGAVEFEVLGSRALWSVTPAAGWRAYDQVPDTGSSVSLHSSYAFYELDAFVDQALLDRLRLRALTSLRYELHTDPSQDAGSLYLSMQLRWLAR
ncbi:MAG: hypothetical protein AAB290_05915 [Candidatus Eisenbacteria bacterium]